MDIFEKSNLWTRNLAIQAGDDTCQKARERLRQTFIKTRLAVKPLVEKIAHELPELTMHDIDHLDNLWNIADVIMGEGFEINPAETFILGMAFLLHDAACSTCAFPNGIDDLINTPEWKDFVAQKNFDADEMKKGNSGYKQTLFETLRILHSKQAEKLLTQSWKDLNHEQRYLMEDIQLRNYYGLVIGKISASHGKDIASAESNWANAAPITPHASLELNANTDWSIDCLKLAMLIRCIDAAHIDSIRAPDMHSIFNPPSGVSKEHWKYQNRLGNVSINTQDELYWTSQVFEEKDSDAWWLCYNTMKMIDREIRTANVILKNNQRKELKAKGVLGVNDINIFLQNIPVQGWRPIPMDFQISQIDEVIERFGGVKLYGDRPYLALKELMQNAADAIRARRIYRKNQEIGRIDISLRSKNSELWLHVQDNGIGMSQYVLTHILLDFGRSLWRDDSLRKQWVGLAGENFEAVGQFGIGFFSVFMLGDEIKVTTWRDGDAEDSQSTLYLRNRAKAKPILLTTPLECRLNEFGTRVSVRLKHGRSVLRINKNHDQRNEITLNQLVASLAPALDIDIWCQDEEDTKVKIVSANDWQNLTPLKMLERLYPFHSSKQLSDLTENFLDIEQDGRIVGRACITKKSYFGVNQGVLVHKGIVVGQCSSIIGILLSSNNVDLARNHAKPICSEIALKTWAEKIYNQMKNRNSPDFSTLFLSLGIPASQLPIGDLAGEYVTPQEILHHLQHNVVGEILIALRTPECPDTLTQSEFDTWFTFDEDVIDVSSYYIHREQFGLGDWISSLLPETREFPRSIHSVLNQSIQKIWSNAEILEQERVVGKVNNEEIKADCLVFKNL